MKKKIFSILGILILGLNTVFCHAVSVSYEVLDSQNGEFYIDKEKDFQESFKNIQESLQEDENILEDDEEILIINSSSNFQESSLEAKNENNFQESRINLLNSKYENIFENSSIPENLSYTTVDITDVFTGNIVSHDCNLYLITNFDETEHWNECSVCGKILNKESHNYIDNGWTGGSANACSPNNVHLFTCACGYSYNNSDGRKAHTYKYYSHDTDYIYYKNCSVCALDYTLIHDCKKSDGSRINCSNPGRCSLCGYNYSSKHRGDAVVNPFMSESDFPLKLTCNFCGAEMGEITNHVYEYPDVGYVNWTITLNPPSGYYSFSTNSAVYEGLSIISHTSGLSQTLKVKYTQHQEYQNSVAQYYYYYVNGQYYMNGIFFAMYPEIIPPVITNIKTNNTENWSTDTTIAISGTENYCNSVNITLKDMEDNVYLENITAPVTNNNWNYEINPELESSENTEFILEVKDSIGHATEQNFYICKIDNMPPKAVETETLNTEWSKTKDYIFTSSDYGIGNVSNSVINTDNYELATENENIFYKGYTFTGDVYGETFVPVYMKDGLNNQNVEFISVSNLDNTAPTIENIEYNKSLHNTEIIISANDINEKLNATGSGVTGYAISTENRIPNTFQEENTFNISESGNYYLFVTDAVGNISSQELSIPVQYKVTINPDGGTWKGDTNPKEYITDEPINLYPEPEKEGYIFKEWNISGDGEINSEGELIVGGDMQVTPIWEVNTYPVTFIDYDVTSKEELNRVTKDLNYNTLTNGFDIGNDTTDNAYYPQYRLSSSTEIVVSTNPETNVVYRYFEFCYTSKESHLNFNDNDNADGLRPETYKLQLILEDGTLIDEVTLPTSQTNYTFTNLPKYNEQGKEYIYKIIPIISDRYTPEPPDEDGNTTITYSNPACSINIPKTTTLDGKNGKLNYTIQVEANLFYKDKIIIVPEENVTLTDGVKSLNATITQDKTEFNKEDELTITGRIQTTKKHFAGTWKGTFNFKIKYEVKN